MHFLKFFSTWVLLALGIWLNCKYNYRVMQVNGPDAVTTPMLFTQAFIGSAVLVAVVIVLALLKGERWEADTGEGPGQVVLGGVIIAGIFIVGFLIVEPIINRIDPPGQQMAEGNAPQGLPPRRRYMKVGQAEGRRAQRQPQYPPVTIDDGQGFR